MRASLRGGVSCIEREKPAHGRIVAENRRRMDVAARDFGVRRQDRLGAIECPRGVPAIERNARGLDEGGLWIAWRCGDQVLIYELPSWLTWRAIESGQKKARSLACY